MRMTEGQLQKLKLFMRLHKETRSLSEMPGGDGAAQLADVAFPSLTVDTEVLHTQQKSIKEQYCTSACTLKLFVSFD